jgi:protein-S-isoprenylcysteine O-methyltransferase Ste14
MPGQRISGYRRQMEERLETVRDRILHWLMRTPVQTFIVCPLIVIAFELAIHQGRLIFVPWGVPLLVWGYLQYLCVGNYRLPRAGGTAGMDVPPERMITQGPYRFTRNPMYLGHLIFMFGLTLTFWSWLALVILICRAYWFHQRVLHDEVRLDRIFGTEYAAYRAQVKRWIPGFL